jgi:hypothetical protein
MVRPGEEREDTRQRALLPSGNQAALTVIRRLADARLVVTARDAASGVETAEVTHEALIRHWTLLRTWVDQDREFLRSKARLEQAAALWEKEKRDASRLLPEGRPLSEGVQILASRRSDLGSSVVAFIEASAAAAARSRGRVLWARAAALSALLVIVAAGGLYWDFFYRPHETFYNAYTRRSGVFQGFGPIRAEDVGHRNRMFRIVQKGRFGSVISMSVVDGTGACAARGLPDMVGFDVVEAWDEPQRVCNVEWDRENAGRISRQTVRDATNRVIFSLVYTDANGRTADFRAEKGHFMQMGDSLVTTIRFERIDDNGPNSDQDRFERYTDANGEPKRFIGGIFATRPEYNADGLVVRAVYLGPDDKPIRSAAGFAEVRIKRNDAGSPTEYALFDENGDAVRNRSGVARWKLTYDPHGNQVKEEYFDETGRPTLTKSGHAAVAWVYGVGGKEIERAYFDETGKPTPNMLESRGT